MDENQKTVNNTSKSINALGIASLVLSIVAIAGSWIPFLNIFSIIIALVGILLGIWSFINVLRKKVNSIMLPIIGMVLGILSIVFSSVMNNAAVDSISDNTTSSKVGTSYESDNSQESQTEYSVGDIIAFDNKEVTITNVEKNYSAQYIDPKTDHEFVKLSVSIENKSSKNISVGTYEFKIQDSTGAITSVASPTYLLDDQFQSAELVPGGKRSGSVVFETPQNDSSLKFIYEPSFLSGKKLIVRL